MADTTGIDPKILELLVCPASRGVLEYHAATNELTCERSMLSYPIRDDIPYLVSLESRPLDDTNSV